MKYLDVKKAKTLLGLDLINHSVVISDPNIKDCPMVFISQEFTNQTGYTLEESLGKNCRFLQGPETDSKDIDAIRFAIKSKQKITIDILNYKKMVRNFGTVLELDLYMIKMEK